MEYGFGVMAVTAGVIGRLRENSSHSHYHTRDHYLIASLMRIVKEFILSKAGVNTMPNFKLPKFKAKVSTDSFGDLCADIVDKNNGNTVVACEVDEDYESFIIAAPDMYAEIERDIKHLRVRARKAPSELKLRLVCEMDRKIRLLLKARGDQDA